MASVNKVIILGHLGRDPELRYSPSGSAVCNFSVATSRSWKDKQSGDKVEETEWHRVVFYDRMAEVAGEYLKKGRPVYVEGRLKTRKWQDKEGRDCYTTEIIGESMQLLGGRDDGDGGQSRAPTPAPRQQSRASAPAPCQATGGARSGTGFDDMDDDIPFVTACPSFDMSVGPARRLRRYRSGR